MYLITLQYQLQMDIMTCNEPFSIKQNAQHVNGLTHFDLGANKEKSAKIHVRLYGTVGYKFRVYVTEPRTNAA